MSTHSSQSAPGAAGNGERSSGTEDGRSCGVARVWMTNRKKKSRYYYKGWGKSKAGFITVRGDLKPKDLWQLLSRDTKRKRLKQSDKSKTEQNNKGNHAQERTYRIILDDAPKWIEIEVTRHTHKKNIHYLETTTVMFRDQPQNQILPAWRLLRRIVLDRAVNTEATDAWYDAVVQWNECKEEVPRPSAAQLARWDLAEQVHDEDVESESSAASSVDRNIPSCHLEESFSSSSSTPKAVLSSCASTASIWDCRPSQQTEQNQELDASASLAMVASLHPLAQQGSHENPLHCHTWEQAFPVDYSNPWSQFHLYHSNPWSHLDPQQTQSVLSLPHFHSGENHERTPPQTTWRDSDRRSRSPPGSDNGHKIPIRKNIRARQCLNFREMTGVLSEDDIEHIQYFIQSMISQDSLRSLTAYELCKHTKAQLDHLSDAKRNSFDRAKKNECLKKANGEAMQIISKAWEREKNAVFPLVNAATTAGVEAGNLAQSWIPLFAQWPYSDNGHNVDLRGSRNAIEHLKKLASSRKGELVEIEPEKCEWSLHHSDDWNIDWRWLPLLRTQFLLPSSTSPSQKTGAEDARTRIETLNLKHLSKTERNTYKDPGWQPDWKRQRHYCIVPCVNRNRQYAWLRKCDCTSIGRWLVALGQFVPADKLMAYFNSRRVISHKSPPKQSGAGSAETYAAKMEAKGKGKCKGKRK